MPLQPGSGEPGSAPPAPRWVVPALGLASFISLLSVLGLAPFLPVMAADLGTSVALLGQIPALITLLAAALGLVVGPLADRLGLRRALLLGLASVGVGTLGLALAPSYLIVLGVALIGAIGRATIGPVCQAIAGLRFTGEPRRRALSWVTAGTSGAGIVGIPLLTSIDSALGWRAAFVGLTLLVLASLLLAWFAIEPDRASVTAPLRVTGVLAAFAPLLGHRPTLGLIGASVLSAIGTWGTWTYLGAFYVQQHGVTTKGAGWIYMIVSLGVLPGSLATGGRRRLGGPSRRPRRVAPCRRLAGAAAPGHRSVDVSCGEAAAGPECGAALGRRAGAGR